MAAYKLIVFDWDGTLSDSASRIVAAAHRAAAELGMPMRTDTQIRGIIGLGLREAVEALYPGIDERLTVRFCDAYRRAYFGDRELSAHLFPAVLRTLEALVGRDYVLAVATGKGRAGLSRELGETGLGGMFEVTRCADETRSKPHPQMLLEIMRMVRVTPAETLMVGDTDFDLAMAASAGTGAVGVTYGAHRPARLLELSPLALLDHIADLPPWLDEQAVR